MRKYKATEKFKELGIDDSYHDLPTEVYWDLKNGGVVEMSFVPIKLLEGKYLEEVKNKKISEKISEEKNG